MAVGQLQFKWSPQLMLLPRKGLASVTTSWVYSAALASLEPMLISDSIWVEGSCWRRLGFLLLAT